MSELSRRGFLATTAAAGAAAALPAPTAATAAKPRKARRNRPGPPLGSGGKPTPPADLARIAGDVAGGNAVTFLDLAAFDNNLRVIGGFARDQGWALRPSLKSFESPRFIAYVLQQLPEPRGLIFHLRVVDEIMTRAPVGTDLQMGYPPSFPELAKYLSTPPPKGQRRHTVRILVDSIELLEELARQARTTKRRLPIEVALNLESGLDIGAFETPAELRAAIAVLRRETDRLKLTGVMCYDGHGSFRGERDFRQTVADDAQRRYAEWMVQLRAEASDLFDEATLIRNGPGSSTYRLWRRESATEISPGAGLLFHGYITGDGYDNAGLQPTLHHAACVHRFAGEPGVPLVGLSTQGSDMVKVACKGGAWPTSSGTLTQVVHPAGLQQDDLAGGRGNNQGHFIAPKGLLKRGDYIVFRPKHAGDAIDYFDALVVVREGSVKRVWPTTSRPGRI